MDKRCGDVAMVVLLGILVSFGTLFMTTGVAGTPPPADLKNLVIEYQKKLPTMEPWQKKLFADEIIPQYQKFVIVEEEGAAADPDEPAPPATRVNEELIKKYLAFYAPLSLQLPDPKVLVLLSPDETCQKCKSSIPAVKALAKARVTRRGFQVFWLELAEVPEADRTNSKLIESWLGAQVKSRNAHAALWVKWGNGIQGLEKPYLFRTFFQLGTRTFVREFDVSVEDRFESMEAKGLNEIFSELGKAEVAERAPAQIAPSNKVLVVLSGAFEFSQFARIKGLLMSQIKDVTGVTEKKVARGQMTLEVEGGASVEELKAGIERVRGQVADEKGLKLTFESGDKP